MKSFLEASCEFVLSELDDYEPISALDVMLKLNDRFPMTFAAAQYHTKRALRALSDDGRILETSEGFILLKNKNKNMTEMTSTPHRDGFKTDSDFDPETNRHILRMEFDKVCVDDDGNVDIWLQTQQNYRLRDPDTRLLLDVGSIEGLKALLVKIEAALVLLDKGATESETCSETS